jgi:hypothetical protein
VDVTVGGASRVPVQPAGWVRSLELWLSSRFGTLPIGPFGGWIDVRLVAAKPKPAHIAGRSTIVERLAIDVVHRAEEIHSFDRARFVAAFDAIRDAIAALAGDSIASHEGYDIPRLITAFDDARAMIPSDEANLVRLTTELDRAWRVGVRVGEELWRAAHPRPLDHAFRGLREYGAPDTLRLEVNIVLVCLEDQLRRRALKLPGYREIYFRTATDVDAARRQCGEGDWWYCETPTALDVSRCLERPEHERCLQILEAFEEGLLRLAELDHLDAAAIGSACAELRSGGFEREIDVLSSENATHRASVFHQARPAAGARNYFSSRLFYLRVLDKREGRTAVRELGQYDDTNMAHIFGTLRLTKAAVRVSPRASFSAEISRKLAQAPQQWVFAMDDLFP